MSILDKIKKNSTIKDTVLLTNSKFVNKKDMISTEVPAINVAMSGCLEGGMTPGITQWVGPSKHFKTSFSLLLSKAYMDKYEDAALLFYDSEFGTPQAYFKSFGIDTDRVMHTPITDIEELKFDLMTQINNFERGDRVIIIIDSIGNLASKREIDNALDQKSSADFTRAKELKSLFRMVTPHLTMKDIPLIVVNHSYKEMALFPKDIVGGGTGSYYSSDNIFILGRQQEKEGTEITGYNFVINVEKSRYVKEKSKILINVTFDGGISKYSGMIEWALESGHIIKGKIGNSLAYQRVNLETGEIEEEKYKEKDTNTEQFWKPILADKKFSDFIRNKYMVAQIDMIQTESLESAISKES